MKAERLWRTIALALAVAAAAVSLHLWLSGFRYRDTLAHKQETLRQVRSYAGRWAGEESLVDQWEAQQAWAPAELDELVARTLGAAAVRITPHQPSLAFAGWQRRAATLEVNAGSYADAAKLLTALGTSAPPWRVREIDFRPAAEAGQGALALDVEGLEKQHP